MNNQQPNSNRPSDKEIDEKIRNSEHPQEFYIWCEAKGIEYDEAWELWDNQSN